MEDEIFPSFLFVDSWVIALHDIGTPEAYELIKKEYKNGDFIVRNRIIYLMNYREGLQVMGLLGVAAEDDENIQLRERAKKMLEKKQENYATSTTSTEDEEFNHGYLLSNTEQYTGDRNSLEQEIHQDLKGLSVTRRVTVDYIEEFAAQTERLSTPQLNKINLLLQRLKDDEFRRNEIGSLIREDLKNKKTEFGGLVIFSEENELIFKEYYPENLASDFAYIHPYLNNELEASIAYFHLHAISESEMVNAGPSGVSGDLTTSEISSKDGIVITPIGNGMFNIDFYTPQGVVIDLGNYDYEQ